MVLMIDNYDSFTYNLVALLEGRGLAVYTLRPEGEALALVTQLEVTGVVVSPGPGAPEDASITQALMRHYWGRVPLLGICLGQQLAGWLDGAQVIRAHRPVHGKTSEIQTDGQGLFAGLPERLTVMRYHSLVVATDTLPETWLRTAWTQPEAPDVPSELMAMRHRKLPIECVQFHPESILTPDGEAMIGNWVRQHGVR